MSLRKKLKLDCPNETSQNEEYDSDAESKYFKNSLDNTCSNVDSNISDKFLQIELNLVSKLNCLNFNAPIDCVYSPLEYAYFTHSLFVKKYCLSTKKILFLGLNPGPWGMSQTGVPFGEINIVRDWLKIEGPVQKPSKELSARPITGFNCLRSEISGKIFWSLFQTLCGTPEVFFKHAYIHNYCPIALMKNSGVNVTPADLKSAEAAKLLEICDESLSQVIKLLKIETVVAIGRFAQKRAGETVKKYKLTDTRVVFILHPSPRVPHNDKWHETATQSLTDLDLLQYFQH